MSQAYWLSLAQFVSHDPPPVGMVCFPGLACKGRGGVTKGAFLYLGNYP